MKESNTNIETNNTSNVIRIPEDEYSGFPEGDLLMHFNLEKTDCTVGEHYFLPRIVKHGHITDDGEEVEPELSFKNIFEAECLEVTNHVPYESLKPKDFTNSFKHIQNVEDLKTYILKRYHQSKPNLSEEQLLAKGISRMLLRLQRP